VVQAALARRDDLDAEAEVAPLLPAFEVRVLPTFLASDPRHVAGVDDEPPVALGDETQLRPIQLRLRNGHDRP
jgi:hypothetical protein